MVDWEPKLIKCAEELLCLESRRLLCHRHSCFTKQVLTKPLLKSLLALDLQQFFYHSWIHSTSRSRNVHMLKGKLRAHRQWSYLDGWKRFSRMNLAKKSVAELRGTKYVIQAFLQWFHVACNNKSLHYKREPPPYMWSSVIPWISELIRLGLVLQVSSKVGIKRNYSLINPFENCFKWKMVFDHLLAFVPGCHDKRSF